MKKPLQKKTLSLLLIAGFFIIIFSCMFISPQLYQQIIHEGDVALKNIYAPYDFTYLWGVDEEKTEAAKKAALAEVPYFLKRDTVLEEKIKSDVINFFAELSAAKAQGTPVGASISDKNLKVIQEYPDYSELEKKTLNILNKVFLSGYISDSDEDRLKAESIGKITVTDPQTGASMPLTLENMLNKGKIEKAIESYAQVEFASDRRLKHAVSTLLMSFISPNLTVDDEKTKAAMEEAVKNVNPIYRSWEVKKNELIIGKGKRVGEEHIAQMSQLRRIFKPGITPVFFLGVILLFLLLALVAVIHTLCTENISYLKNPKNIAIVFINILLIIAIADFIMRSPQPSYFIPMASIGMMITLFVGFNIAFISVVLTSLIISLVIGGGIELMLVLVVGSSVGMIVIKDARRRARILWAGLLVGLAKVAAVSCIGLINGMELDFYVRDGSWCLASGFLSGFIVMGLSPIFEYLFKIPTNISLLELSDLNHPLLKRLALEAPGTYHHSIMVGNLAETACDAIGANSLLARVGAYYHDIGKMLKAEYFSENEMGERSKHSNLAPSMSALIISKHVKAGVDLANKYKLNSAIIDFIAQHHGDSLISYFYQKAIEKSEEGEMLEEESFRYPGPKPQTKESAIILLADSVEAASRSLTDASPSSIRNLVRKMINNKFIDGQLDECDLTLKDINKIADSFARVLMGVFHTRLNYPEETKEPVSDEMFLNEDKDKLRKSK